MFVLPHLDHNLTNIGPDGNPLNVFEVFNPWLLSRMFPEPGLVPTVNQNSTFPFPVFHVNVVVEEMLELLTGLVS